MKPHFPWSNVKQENERLWRRKGSTLKSDCIDVELPRHYGSLFLCSRIWQMHPNYRLLSKRKEETYCNTSACYLYNFRSTKGTSQIHKRKLFFATKSSAAESLASLIYTNRSPHLQVYFTSALYFHSELFFGPVSSEHLAILFFFFN